MGTGNFDDVTAIILAGGQSTRMAALMTSSKAFLKIAGETVIERELNALRSVFKEVLVVSNEPRPYLDLGLRVIPDSGRFPEIKGPIKGIFSGLEKISGGFGFVVACDMPFINPLVVEWIGDGREGFDAVIPRTGGYFEPLFGYYGKGALPLIESAMEAGVRRIQEVFASMHVKVVDEQGIRFFDPGLESFINLNTPEDLARAESIIRRPVITATQG